MQDAVGRVGINLDMAVGCFVDAYAAGNDLTFVTVMILLGGHHFDDLAVFDG